MCNFWHLINYTIRFNKSVVLKFFVEIDTYTVWSTELWPPWCLMCEQLTNVKAVGPFPVWLLSAGKAMLNENSFHRSCAAFKFSSAFSISDHYQMREKDRMLLSVWNAVMWHFSCSPSCFHHQWYCCSCSTYWPKYFKWRF